MSNLQSINKEYDRLQSIYGLPSLNAIYGGGCTQRPRVALVFMNPTGRNVAADRSWQGIRAPWLGLKPVWSYLARAGLFDPELYQQISHMKPAQWTPEFCEKVYAEVARQGVYITNLAKCTQDDARALPDSVFESYKPLLMRELKVVNPKDVILFGGQVARVVLGKKVVMADVRRKRLEHRYEDKSYGCYVVYYPVGNGRFNQAKAIEDIKAILKT